MPGPLYFTWNLAAPCAETETPSGAFHVYTPVPPSADSAAVTLTPTVCVEGEQLTIPADTFGGVSGVGEMTAEPVGVGVTQSSCGGKLFVIPIWIVPGGQVDVGSAAKNFVNSSEKPKYHHTPTKSNSTTATETKMVVRVEPPI